MNDHDEDHSYISKDLDTLTSVETELARLCSEKESQYDDLITEDVRLRMTEIDEEFNGQIAAAETSVVQLRKVIKAGVLEHHDTVKGKHLMAVWNRGRVSWDTAALKGYAVTHPEVNQLRKTGDPSVTIRKV